MAALMELRSRVAVGLAGVHVGILGAIIAAGSSEVSKQSGNAVAFGSLVWVVGLFLSALALLLPSGGPTDAELAGRPKGPTS
jgi:hypothetical protein